MINKKFLAPVLALAALGLPARASLVEYCGSGCGSNDQAAFNNVVFSNAYIYEGLETFVATNLSGSIYDDPTSTLSFADFYGFNLSVSGGTLSTASNNHEAIVITLPSTVPAVEFTVLVPSGVCIDQYCPTSEASGFVGAVNSSPSGAWTVTISPLGGGNPVQISDFNAATAGVSNSDTPEVGTLLLIGAGLIAMRWLPRRAFRTPRLA